MADEATTSQAVEDNNNVEATTTFVVGEHSVYNSVQDLFEGAKQKEMYIAKLQQDLSEARATIEDLSQQKTIVEKLEQIRENNMDNTENTNTSSLPEEAIKQIALNAMQEQNKAQQAESNLANCKQAVASVNADVELALKNKAQELGCSVEYLEGIAKTSPKAFKNLFGIKENTMSFDSINFLQSSRQVGNESSNIVDEFFNSKNKSTGQIAEFMKKVQAHPELLDNVKKW